MAELNGREIETFAQAKQLLLGAVDTVFQTANKLRACERLSQLSGEAVPAWASTSRPTAHASEEGISYDLAPERAHSLTSYTSVSGGGVSRPTDSIGAHSLTAHKRGGISALTYTGCCTSSSSPGLGSVGLQEHRRLFKFQPSKATKRSKGNAPVKSKRGRRGPSTWKKECICLSSCNHLSIPTTEERMELAGMGLGLKELQFDVDGGPVEIHKLILAEYPQLEAAGGYSLLRLSENSRELVEIETPGRGLTVPYLKDIVRQAKLYIRPLQCDLQITDVKPTIVQVATSVNHVLLISLC